ncbi:hypothetical protein EMPS_09198 [Entomortierella parvispora]|uniref:Mid2 domain-containing protein n=1 Tax=Entomortierella parvispora TaxID=205924 RepID=A0A9P3M016_9FUNG|nr:hypothetical protein EMPS_09198 [Entomortierella parvispora]
MLPTRQSTSPRTGIVALAALAALAVLLLPSSVLAQSDPIIQYCSTVGCDTVVTLLDPCGGGATNASLQQDLIYTPTPILGSCECNSQFFNAFSSCLSCITSQGKSSPQIDNQQNWVASCKTYGFNFTDAPINFTQPIVGGDNSGSGGGISKGAIIGIVVAVLLVAALAGAFFFLRNRKRRTKGSIFERPYMAAGSGTGSYAATPTGFNTNSHYQNADYPQDDYTPQGLHGDSYYDYNQGTNTQQFQQYSSEQNEDDLMMTNLQHSNYIPPPVPMSPTALAAVASPRPSDQFPQSLRSKPLGWSANQQEVTSDLLSSDLLLHNDKAVYEDTDEIEPPRSRDRFVHDRDNYSARSLTPPRATMQSYRDDFSRPSFEREPRSSVDRSWNASPRAGLRSTQETDDEDDRSAGRDTVAQESPESARRRRAAELFSAEGTRR